MAQYPSYSYPQMNPYQNNYNQQIQQPYMDRMAQLQQYQQNLQMQPAQMSGANQQFQQMPVGINGKVVPAVENITANDVPMDGSVAFFPKQDMSEIYAKSWNADGTIRTIVFKPVLDNNPNNLPQSEEKLKIGLSEDVTEAFMKRFDEIEKRLDDFGLSLTKSLTKSTKSLTKKEVEAE